MKSITRSLLVVFVLVGFLLSACGAKPAKVEKVSPSSLEPVEGTDLSRVKLTEKAAQRIGLQTVPVNGAEIPYAAVIYDIEGKTWVYTNPEPLVFVRAPIVIDHIEGNTAVLSEGPGPDMKIVTVGVAELYGAETGVSK